MVRRLIASMDAVPVPSRKEKLLKTRFYTDFEFPIIGLIGNSSFRPPFIDYLPRVQDRSPGY